MREMLMSQVIGKRGSRTQGEEDQETKTLKMQEQLRSL